MQTSGGLAISKSSLTYFISFGKNVPTSGKEHCLLFGRRDPFAVPFDNAVTLVLSDSWSRGHSAQLHGGAFADGYTIHAYGLS